MSNKDYEYELNVLLNSYLDGELSTAKSEKVERLLAEDEYARGLLAELCKVSEEIGSLPHSKAPDDMADAVLQDIERDILLDQKDSLAEEAGQKHLRLRRLLEAAAMVALTGAMVIIVYNVLKDSESSVSGPKEPIFAPEVAVRMPEPAKKDIGTGKNSQQSLADAGKVAKEPEEVVPIPEITYSSVEMVVEVRVDIEPWARMEQMLANRQIDRVLQANLSRNQRQYVFLCSVEQFSGVFEDLTGDTTATASLTEPAGNNLLNIKLTVADQDSGRSVTVNDVTSAEAKMLAGEANVEVQLASATGFWPKDRIIVHNEQPDLPAELLEKIVQAEPTLPGLRLLGPKKKEKDPNKDVKPAPLISANVLSVEPTKVQIPPANDQPISQKAQLVAVKLILQVEPLTNQDEAAIEKYEDINDSGEMENQKLNIEEETQDAAPAEPDDGN